MPPFKMQNRKFFPLNSFCPFLQKWGLSIKVEGYGVEWIRMNQNGSEWIRMDQNGSEWIRVDPVELKLAKVV